jgi:hypothetical protein
MTFKVGDPRPPNAGKKKGSKSKKSLLVKEILDSHGINLIEKINQKIPLLAADEQVKTYIALLPYVYPKLTAIDHSGTITTNQSGSIQVRLSEDELKAELNENLKKLKMLDE